MASIKDVAKRAGVSVATVSRVLANKPHVRPELRALVLQAVSDERYRPSRIAGNMRNQSSRMIGLLISDIRNPFFTAIARAIEDVANQHEMSVFLCNTDEAPDKEDIYLESLLEERVAGVILSPAREGADSIQLLLENNIPVVAVDRRIVGAHIDGVFCDNHVSAQMLTAHLIEAGCQRIGAIFGLKHSMTGRERMEGYLMALAQAGMTTDPTLAIYVHPSEPEGEKIVSAWLASPHRPDAILTGNSRLTIGALNAIAAAGLLIPRDIILAGFDETAWMRHAAGGITVISQPTYEIGRAAAELLFLRMADPTRAAREVVLKGTLIARASTMRRA